MDSTDLAHVRRTLWAAADELRANSSLAPNEYRGLVLGLIFLAYAEHRFEQIRPEVEAKATARRPVIRVFDPACGSGGMFVQCAKFVEGHQESATKELSVYGQEQKEVTVPLAKMNLALHASRATSASATATTTISTTLRASSTS